MKTILVALLLILSVSEWSAATVQSGSLEVLAEFPGASLKWLHIAEPVFEREKLDIDKYTISIIDEGDSVTVILRASGLSENVKGSLSWKPPGYEVEDQQEGPKDRALSL